MHAQVEEDDLESERFWNGMAWDGMAWHGSRLGFFTLGEIYPPTFLIDKVLDGKNLVVFETAQDKNHLRKSH